MSYILDIVAPAVPADDSAAYDFIDQLRLASDADALAPAPALLAFHSAITQQFPCLSTCSDDAALEQCVWSDGPLLNNFSGDMGTIAISSRVGEVLPAILRLAPELGLTVADQQRDKIHRPPGFRVVLLGTKEGWNPDQVAARLAPLFKRSQEHTRAMLDGPRLTIKQGLDRAMAQRYLDTLERLGCSCAIEADGPAPAKAPVVAEAAKAAVIAMATLEPIVAEAAKAPVVAAAANTPPSQEDLAMQRWLKTVSPSMPPKPAAVVKMDDNAFQDEQMADLADGQKQYIYMIACNLVLLKMWAGDFKLALMLLCFVAILIQSILGILRMASGLQLSPTAKALAIVSIFVPVLGLIVLLLMNGAASKQLKEAGYRVGWLGVSAQERAMLRGRGPGPGIRNGALATAALILLTIGVGGGAKAKAGAGRDDTSHPCALVGVWTAERTNSVYQVTLNESGAFDAQAIVRGGFSGATVYGTWEVRKDNIHWTYAGGSPASDVNPLTMRKGSQGFTVLETNGEETRYTLIKRLSAARCEQGDD
ncbi:MAG TPA: hypothetical protein DCW29_07545 [Janthinobacterium sp.]|nr:hypothetical protein [Janthinobacterium sp.]